MLAETHLQMIIDVIFFVTIFILLWQLNRKISHQRPPLDRKMLIELERMMARSQEQVNLFLKAVEEREQTINKLLRQLDSQEKKLLILIEQSESLADQKGHGKLGFESKSSSERYDHILKMMEHGLSPEEIAKRSGLTEGEIQLVIELANTRSSRR